jgi:hypothetical protein
MLLMAKGGGKAYAAGEINEIPLKESIHALNKSMEHEEAVQRHIEQGRLTPYESAIYILQNGSVSQRISMLDHIPRTLREVGDERKTNQLLAQLTEAMWTQDLELQCAAPTALIGVLGMLKEPQVLTLLTGARNMLGVRSEEARRAWGVLALELVQFLPPVVLAREMVPLALSKGDHSEPPDQRVLGCVLIGRLCERMDAGMVQSTQLLARAIQLCQDTETLVRIGMCQQLGSVARAMGVAATKELLMRELLQLLSDEEAAVSRAAFSALIDLVEFFDAPYRREHLLPIVRSYLAHPPDFILPLLVEEFGRFLWKIRADVQSSADDTALFANFFRQSAQKPDAELRRLCAYNVPAVAAALPLPVLLQTIVPTVRALAADAHAPTRRAIAAGLHELAALLGDRSGAQLREPFLTLLQDPSLDVRYVVAERLTSMLDLFATQLRNDERESFFTAAVPHLISYEAAVHKDWRRSAQLLQCFSHFPRYLPGYVLQAHFIAPLLQHLVNGAAQLRDQCAELLMTFARAIGNNVQIAELLGRVVADFGRGHSCRSRATYVALFRAATLTFSRRFIRARLLEPLLDLSRDPVPNVRIQLARALPTVRRVLRPPIEPEHLPNFQAAVARLRADPDVDVRDAAEAVQGALEELERDLARQAALRLNADDATDRRREDAEGDLLEVAREQEKLERRQKLREMLLRETSGDSGIGGGGGGGAAGGVSGSVDSRANRESSSGNSGAVRGLGGRPRNGSFGSGSAPSFRRSHATPTGTAPPTGFGVGPSASGRLSGAGLGSSSSTSGLASATGTPSGPPLSSGRNTLPPLTVAKTPAGGGGSSLLRAAKVGAAASSTRR